MGKKQHNTTCKQNVFKRKRKENHAAKFCRAPIYTQCNLGNYCKVYKYISLHRYWFSIGFCNNWTRIQNNCQHWNGIGIGCIASSRLVTHTEYFVNNQTNQTSVCARRIDDGIYILINPSRMESYSHLDYADLKPVLAHFISSLFSCQRNMRKRVFIPMI